MAKNVNLNNSIPTDDGVQLNVSGNEESLDDGSGDSSTSSSSSDEGSTDSSSSDEEFHDKRVKNAASTVRGSPLPRLIPLMRMITAIRSC